MESCALTFSSTMKVFLHRAVLKQTPELNLCVSQKDYMRDISTGEP